MTEKTLRERMPVGDPRNKLEFLADEIEQLNSSFKQIELDFQLASEEIYARLSALELKHAYPRPAFHFRAVTDLHLPLGFVAVNKGDTLEYKFLAKTKQEDPNSVGYQVFEYPFSGMACNPATMWKTNDANHPEDARDFIVRGFDAEIDGKPLRIGDIVPTDGAIHHVKLTATKDKIGVSGIGLQCNFPLWDVKINTQARNYFFPFDEGEGSSITEKISGEKFEIHSIKPIDSSHWVTVG